MFGKVTSRLALCVLASALLVGCGGGSKESIDGSLEVNGSPLVLEGDDEATITFVHEQGKGSFSANLGRESKNFTLSPAGDESMAPGKYKVAVTITSYSRPTDSNGQELDKLQGNFSVARTPLSYEVVTGERQQLVIDLAKRTVVKK